MRLILPILVLIASTVAAVREIAVWRSGMLAQQRTPDRLRAALAYAPEDATIWRLLGIALLQSDADAAQNAFRRALVSNSYETDALIGLGMLAEARHDSGAAESLYLQAAQSSRRFRPAYALAAFYARAGRLPEFWQAASAAAGIDKADVGRILRLARDTGGDSDSLADRLHLRTEHSLAAYLQVALAENRPVPIAQAAMRLPATPDRMDALLAACDRLIQAGDAQSAVSVWNRLGVFPPLDAAAGRSLTNPQFSFSPVAGGFNWRFAPVPGVRIAPGSAGLHIELSSEQPEHAVLLQQIVPLAAGRRYRFTVQSETLDMAKTAGLAWQLQCVPSQDVLTSEPIVNPSLRPMSMEFSTPGACDLARLMLVYDRQMGTVRISGTLHLESAELDLLP